MRPQRLWAVLAADALSTGMPLQAALRACGPLCTAPVRYAIRSAEAGDLRSALAVLGLHPILQEAAQLRPEATLSALHALDEVPPDRALNLPAVASAGYLLLVLGAQTVIAEVLRQKVIPVLRFPAGDPPTALAAFGRDLGEAFLPAVGTLAALWFVAAVAVLFWSLGRPNPGSWFRGHLRDAQGARAARVAGALEEHGARPEVIAAFVSRHAPWLKGAGLPWRALSDHLSHRALARSRSLTRRVRVLGTGVAVLSGLVIAATVYLTLPALSELR